MTTEVEFRKRLEGDQCVYCGNRAQCGDHWPPRSLTRQGYLLPACMECNSLASDLYPYDFKNRSELVKDKLRARYDTDGRIENSDERELEECDRKVQQRLAWSAEVYICLIDHSNDFVHYGAETNTTMTNESKSSNTTSNYVRKSKANPEVICKGCEETFTQNRPWQKFCSKACHQQFHLAETREAREAYRKAFGD